MLRRSNAGLPSHGYDTSYNNGGGGSYGGSTSGNGGSTYGGYGGYGYGGTPSKQRRGSSSSNNFFSRNGGFGSLNTLQLVCVGLGFWALMMMGLWWNASSNYKTFTRSLQVSSGQEALDLLDSLKADVRAEKSKARDIKREAQKKYSSQISDLERENRLLQKERDELKAKHEGPDKKEASERSQLREAAFQEQVALLKEATRRESKRTVLERFGPGPHKVEFTYTMPNTEKDYQFVVEMAPLDLVPHAIHLFLEQVAHGLWDHSFMYLNGPHVLQIGPQDFNTDDDANALHSFYEAELDEMMFPDYSQDFPHLPWTLGYTGRPGGPDFYINKVDNTKAHGPGGQYQHVLEEQGDSCFGKIISGHQHLRKHVFSLDIYKDNTDYHWFFVDPVEIIQVVILKEEKVQQQEQQPSGGRVPKTDDAPKNTRDKNKRKARLPKMDHMAEA